MYSRTRCVAFFFAGARAFARGGGAFLLGAFFAVLVAGFFAGGAFLAEPVRRFGEGDWTFFDFFFAALIPRRLSKPVPLRLANAEGHAPVTFLSASRLDNPESSDSCSRT